MLEARTNHPDKPAMGDDEDYVEYICRTADHWSEHPPVAPEGFDLVECGATPRHFPIYTPVDDDLYPAHCLFCERDATSKDLREAQCKARHRRWKSWNVLQRIASRLYVLGITSTGGGTSFGRCEFCGIGRQHLAPRWKGRRVYILGKPREFWACLRRGHIYRPLEGRTFHLCAICLPCSTCGSTDPWHRDSIDCPEVP